MVNSFFFKEFTSSGLLGGVFIAALVAIFNIGLGFIYGEYIARYINHISGLKIYGLCFGSYFFRINIICNFFAAHLRDAIDFAIETNQAAYTVDTMAVANKLFSNTLDFQSFESILLILIGMTCSIDAVIKMFIADDPYPGYGALDREKKIKTDAHYHEIREYLNMCRDLMLERVLDIRTTIENIS